MKRSIARPLIAPAAALALSGLLLATALVSFPAQAGAPATAPALQVKVGDLDLTRPAGIAILYQRLQFAAQQVCGPSGVTGTRLRDRDWQNCINAAVENAVRQLDRPALTAYHRSHAGQNDTERS
jgi:UrcA family protein